MTKDILHPKVEHKITELVTPEFYEDWKLNVYKLAKALKIELFEAIFDDDAISGYISKTTDQDNFEIVVNKRHSNSRKRFTVAHEIGHYISYIAWSYSKDFLSWNDDVITDSLVAFRSKDIPDDKKNMELEANEIAAELLMPKVRIEVMVMKNFSIADMAMVFEVSKEAMSVRLARLYPYHFWFLF